ncbi:MAG TPA: cellulase family glycosylhydrolase [Rhodothermales bacterium]
MPHFSGRISSILLLLALSGSAASGCDSSDPDDGNDTTERPTFYVEGRHLYDVCGEPVVLRGVNKMTVWMDRQGSTFPEIAKTGANAVRTVWSIEVEPQQADLLLLNAKRHGLIPMLEMHDATGNWGMLDRVVDYWTRPETVQLIRKHEKYLLVNIANEAGQDVPDNTYRDKYIQIIQRMRRAGIRVPLVVDASGWGRDHEQVLRVGPAIVASDSLKNTMMSVHWWHSDNNTQRITSALERSVSLNLPFIVGEFAHAEIGCRGRIAYEHILAEAQRLGIGWLAWSWGPGNSDCAAMDMTEDGSFDSLHEWGLEVAVTDPNSIKNTSVRPHYMVNGTCE